MIAHGGKSRQASFAKSLDTFSLAAVTAGLHAPSGYLSGQSLDEESKELAGRDHPNGPELVGEVSGVASDEVGRVRLYRTFEELIIL